MRDCTWYACLFTPCKQYLQKMYFKIVMWKCVFPWLIAIIMRYLCKRTADLQESVKILSQHETALFLHISDETQHSSLHVIAYIALYLNPWLDNRTSRSSKWRNQHHGELLSGKLKKTFRQLWNKYIITQTSAISYQTFSAENRTWSGSIRLKNYFGIWICAYVYIQSLGTPGQLNHTI